MRIILASQSQRRKYLMNLAKIQYEVIVSDYDESVDEKLSLEEQSIEIAYQKAKNVFDKIEGDKVVIASDTLVIVNEKQFGKAKNREEAIKMLKEIQGNMHFIYTGFSILIEKNGEYKEYKKLSKSKVHVKKMSNEEIENYVDAEKPYFCAGAYAIQGFFAVYVEKIEGDYYSILGFPINEIYEILKNEKVLT